MSLWYQIPFLPERVHEAEREGSTAPARVLAQPSIVFVCVPLSCYLHDNGARSMHSRGEERPMKDATVSARVEYDVKNQAEEILR